MNEHQRAALDSLAWWKTDMPPDPMPEGWEGGMVTMVKTVEAILSDVDVQARVEFVNELRALSEPVGSMPWALSATELIKTTVASLQSLDGE